MAILELCKLTKFPQEEFSELFGAHLRHQYKLLEPKTVIYDQNGIFMNGIGGHFGIMLINQVPQGGIWGHFFFTLMASISIG